MREEKTSTFEQRKLTKHKRTYNTREGDRRDQMTKTILCIARDSNYNIRINLYDRIHKTQSIDIIPRSISTNSRIPTRTDLLDQQVSKQDRIRITTKGHCVDTTDTWLLI